MNKTASITAADIAGGCPGNAYCCPAFLAIQRVTRSITRVDCNTINYYLACHEGDKKFRSAMIATPEIVSRFIILFDAEGAGAVEPIEFDLELPDWAQPPLKEFL